MPDAAPRRLYGRRKGRRLRRGQEALLEAHLPGLSLELPPPGEAIDPCRTFGAPAARLWLEVGFGDGEHLASQAASQPDVALIGCEPFLNGVAKALRRVVEGGLDNVRLHAGDARAVIDALPDGSLDRVFVLFPDPWRKSRHHRRRFVSADTLAALGRAMADGAELRIATDHPGYLDWILEHMARAGWFEWLARGAADWRQRPPDAPATRYEQKALAAGRRPVYLRYRRRPR